MALTRTFQARIVEVDELREKGMPTVPTTLVLEKATNPFLRPHSPEIQRVVGLEGGDLVEVFAKVRQLKDNF